MADLRLFFVFFLIVFLVPATAASSSGPTRKPKRIPNCSRHCRVSKPGKFKYASGHAYDFDYSVETATHTSPTPGQAARLAITAVAQVHVISTCEMLLKLRDVRIAESDGSQGRPSGKVDNSKYFRSELEKYSLRYSFLDGQVSDLCPDDNETTWALNVKRGLLSLFQNSMKKFAQKETVVETDVLGQCQALYQPSGGSWFSDTVIKSRDRRNCTMLFNDQPLGLDWQTDSKLLKSVIGGNQECVQMIDWNGILISATCTEENHFRPMPGEATGIVTEVKQSLKYLQRRERGTFSPSIYKRVGMEYESFTRESQEDSEDGDSRRDTALRKVQTVLRQLCKREEVQPRTVGLFYDLVTNVRYLNAQSLRVLHEKVSGTALCLDHQRVRKFYLDALAMSGTEAAVLALSKALSRHQGQVSLDIRVLLSTIAFLPTVTTNMLHAARVLLEHPPLTDAALLPVSSLVSTYCGQHVDCGKTGPVLRLAQVFRRLVGPQCYANEGDSHRVVLSLRAIGNAGHVVHMTEVLNNCAKRRKNPLDVRVAAMEAFRRFPCQNSLERSHLIFENTSEDPEVRIASYLTIMHCASTSVFRRMQRTLSGERDSQVLSFVVSHLSHLKNSSTEHDSDITRVLDTVDISTKDLGRLRLSRYTAGNFLSDSLGVSGSVIWPPASSSLSPFSTSWFPRSLSTNMTLTWMGQNLHVAEVGVRGEGLEFLLQNMILPLLGKKRPPMGPKMFQSRLDRVRGSLWARVMGRDVGLFQLGGGDDSLVKRMASGKFFGLKDVLSKLLAHGTVTQSQSLVLLDKRVRLSTSCGLPLTVALTSTASAQVRVSGKLDLRRVLAKPFSLLVNGTIAPSAAAKIVSTMSIDAIVTEVGLRMTGSVHSDTILKGVVQMDRGKAYNLELDVPREKMQILDVRSEWSLITGKKELPLHGTAASTRNFSVCTGNPGVQILGLDLCGEMVLPALRSQSPMGNLLVSPSSLSVALHRRDSFSHFKLLAQHVKTSNYLKTHLLLGTPGSDVDRTFEVYLNTNMKKRTLDLRLASPWKKAELSSAITNSRKTKEIRCFLVVDNKQTYGIVSQVKVTRSKTAMTIKPKLELQSPNLDPIKVDGHILVGKHWKTVTFDVSVVGVLKRPAVLKGSFTNSKREVSVRGSANSGTRNSYSFACGAFLSGKLSSKIEASPFLYVNTPHRQLISVSGRGDYRRNRMLRADVSLVTDWTEPVSVHYSLLKLPSKSDLHYVLETKVKMSGVMVAIDAETEVKVRQLLLTRLIVKHDVPSLLPKDSVSFLNKLSGRRREGSWTVSLQSKLDSNVFSQCNYNIKLNSDHQRTKSRLKLYYGQGTDYIRNGNYVIVTSKMRHDMRDLRNVVLAFEATTKIPSENVDVEVKASHSHNSKVLKSKASVSYGGGQESRASLTVVNKGRGPFVSLSGRFLLVVAESPTPGVPRPIRASGSAKRRPHADINFKVAEKEDKYEVKSGAHFQKKRRDFLSTLIIRKPVSLRRVQMYCKGIPYSKDYKEFEAEFTHSMHPLLAEVIESLLSSDSSGFDVSRHIQLLMSSTGAALVKNETEYYQTPLNAFVINDYDFDRFGIDRVFSTYQNLSSDNDTGEVMDDHKVALKGAVDVKSSFVDMVVASLNFDHNEKGTVKQTDLSFDGNGRYKYHLATKNAFSASLQSSVGSMMASTPRKKLSLDWLQRKSDKELSSTLSTSWAQNRRLYFDLNARGDKTDRKQEFFGDVTLQSPWKPIRDWRMSVGHDAAPGLFRSKSTVRRNNRVVTSHDVTLVHAETFVDGAVSVFSPWTRNVSGSVSSQHGGFPVSSTAELAWTPRQKVTVTGSADLTAWDNAEASVSMKTTLPYVRATSAKVSNRVNDGRMSSEVTANYGPSTYTLGTVVRRNDWREVRVRTLTPLDHFRIMDVGFRVDGSLRNLSSSADFRVFPVVNKHEATLNWVYDGNYKSKFHVDIPRKDFPYVKLEATSTAVDKYRISAITLKHAPAKVYALDAKYSLPLPDELKLTVKATDKKVDTFNIELLREPVGPDSELSLNISLPEEKKFKVLCRVHLGLNVTGGINITTPLNGFENSTAHFAYNHGKTEYSTVANVSMGNMTVATRLSIVPEAEISDPSLGDGDIVSHKEKPFRLPRQINLDLIANLDKSELWKKDESTLNISSVYSVYTRTVKIVTINSMNSSNSADNSTSFSKHIQTVKEVFASFDTVYKNVSSVTGNITFSTPTSKPDFAESLTNQTTDENGLANETDNIHEPHAIPRLAVSLVVASPFSRYTNIGTLAKFENVPQVFSLSGANTPTINSHSRKPLFQRMRIESWRKGADGVHVIDAEHTVQSDQHRARVKYQTGVTKMDNFTFALNSTGSLENFTGTAKIDYNQKQLVKTSILHTYHTEESQTVFFFESGFMNRTNASYAHSWHESNTITNISVGLADRFSIHSLLEHARNNMNVRQFESRFAINSAKTGNIEAYSSVAFNTSDVLNFVTSQLHGNIDEKYGNVTFMLRDRHSMALSGQLGVAEKTDERYTLTPYGELNFTHRGVPNDFRTSVFVRHQNSDPIDGVVSARYRHVLDMDVEVSCRSPFPLAQDVTLTARNTHNAHNERRLLWTFGWAPYRKVSVDAVTKHLPSVVGLSHHTDVVVVTPFQQFQTGSVKLRHNRIIANTDRALQAKVNGVTVVDASTFSKDQASLGIQPSFLSLFQRTVMGSTVEEKLHKASVFVRWHLTDPDSKLSVVTMLKTVRDGPRIKDRNFTVSLIHPRDVLQLKYHCHRDSDLSSGEGEVRWDVVDSSNRRVNYRYSLQRLRNSTAEGHEALFKLGTPVRSVEANTLWISGLPTDPAQSHFFSGPRKQKTEAVVFWDADGDRAKHVVVTSEMTHGHRKRAMFSLAAPSIFQDIRLLTDLTVFPGHKGWKGTAWLSYSRDPSKVMQLSSSFVDSSLLGDGTAYALATSLSQPFSDLDLGVTSFIGLNTSIYHGTVEGWYLTSAQQGTQRLAITGTLHLLAKTANITVSLPSKELSLEATSSSGDRHRLSVRGQLLDARGSDHHRHLAASVLLDPFHRSLLLKVTRGPESQGKFIAMEAWFVNDTAIRAEVYRDHVTGSVTDGVLAMRLNTSTLLHTRLTWRPELWQESRTLSRTWLRWLDDYTLNATQRLVDTAHATGDHVSSKYRTVVMSFVDDVTPLLDLWRKEEELLVLQLESALLELTEFYLNNKDLFSTMEKELDKLIKKISPRLKDLETSYAELRARVDEVVKMLEGNLQTLAASYNYDNLVGHIGETIMALRHRASAALRQLVLSIDLRLMQVKDQMMEMSNVVPSSGDFRSYIDVIKSEFASLPAFNGQSSFGSQIFAPDSEPSVAKTNMVGAPSDPRSWMVDHLGPRAKHHALQVADRLSDMIITEASFRLRHFRFIQQSNITVWLPERGEIQAEVCLPFHVESFQKISEWTLANGATDDLIRRQSVVRRQGLR